MLFCGAVYRAVKDGSNVLNAWIKALSVTIQMKDIKQSFPVVPCGFIFSGGKLRNLSIWFSNESRRIKTNVWIVLLGSPFLIIVFFLSGIRFKPSILYIVK